MAIENTYLLGKNITLGCGFDLQAKAPLDSRQTVPAFAGLQALIDGNAAYEGMIVYDEETKKTYQAQLVDGALAFREFGINEAELRDLIASETTAAMEFKGVTASLPTDANKGDMYKVSEGFSIDAALDANGVGCNAKDGDMIVCDGNGKWYVIPSGDDIEDTWRPVTDVDNDATLTFAAGDKLDVAVASNGTVTYSHEAIDAPTATPVGEDEQTRTYITSIETDGHGHITGYKTATENVEDTNTTYEFEGQSDEATSVYFQVKSSEAEAAEVIYLDAYSKNEADAKLAEVKTEAANQAAVVLSEAQAYADGKDAAIEAAQKSADDTAAYVGTFTHDTAKTVVDYINAKTDGIATSGNLEALGQRVTAAEGEIDELQADSHTHDNKDLLDTYTQTEADLADAVAKKHAHTFADTDVEDAIAKKHSHTFVEAELNKIADGDVAKWNAAEQNAKDYADDQIEALALGTMSKETADDYVKKSDATGYGDILTKTEAQGAYQAKGDYAAEEHTHTKNEITDFAHTHTASEVTDLDATIKGYDYATKTELGDVDKKFADYKTAEAQKAIDDEQDRRLGILEGASATHATKDELNGVDGKFASYRTSADQDVIDNGHKERIEALEAKFTGDESVDAQIAAAVKVETEAREAAVKGVQDAVDAMYTNAKIDELIADAKKHADDNDADTKYGITYDSDAKKIKLVEGGTEAEIDATAFIKDGMIESVVLSEDGLNLVITWNTDSDKGENNVTTIPLTGLVDVYTGVEGARINVAVSSDKKVSADIVAGSISKNYLDDGVQASLAKADSALQTHQDISHLATEADLTLAEGRISVLEAIDHDAYIGADATLKGELQGEIASAIEGAKTDASNKDAVVLSEAQKYSDQAKADAIADAEGKVNALAGNVYTKEEVYTKAEVENLLCWGEF